MRLKIFSYKKINSTNDLALKKIKNGVNQGIILSETQKKGRGQYGKKWISKKGNIFLTIFFQVSKKKKLIKLTMENCSNIKKILSSIVGKKITIKPPNDLLIDKRKFCGILQESFFKNNLKFLILGLGINLINSPLIKGYPTTYIQKYNKNVNKKVIIDRLKKSYEKKINYFNT